MQNDPNQRREQMLNLLSSSFAPDEAGRALEGSDRAPRIPDHELVRAIGRGSYGEVWLARNIMGPWRAVKIVYRKSFDTERPFERELAGIRHFEPISRSHPSQLNVLHVGRDDAAGYFYYVMELADPVPPVRAGMTPVDVDQETYRPRTLRSELQARGRMPFDECIQIAIALATALEHLHQNGLVHRDVKPSNIIFVNGIPKLADIGLVATAEATLSLVGTEGYLPPEGPGSPRADIYSLGKVLYEMATGRDRQDFPELPTQRLEQEERRRLAELNAIIVKACEANAAERYATAADLLADLAVLQSGRSVRRLRSVARQLALASRVGAAITIAALIFGGAFVYQLSQTKRERELSKANQLLAEQKSELAKANALLSEESRARVVRMDVANGVRLLDQGDPTGALVWFTDALSLLPENSPETRLHRIRIQQVLDRTPRLLGTLPHESGVISAAYSPDGKTVATSTMEGNLRMWDVASTSLVWGPKKLATAAEIRFSLDGQRVMVSLPTYWPGSTAADYAPILDARDGHEIVKLGDLLPDAATNVLFTVLSTDNRWLAAGQGDRIRVCDLRTGGVVFEQTSVSGFSSAAFDTSGRLIAAGENSGDARVYEVPSGARIASCKHQFPVLRMGFSADTTRLVTAAVSNGGAGNGEIRLWEIPAGAAVGNPVTVDGWMFFAIEPRADGRLFTQGKGELNAWDLRSGKPQATLASVAVSKVNSLCFSPDGLTLACGGDERDVRIFELANTSADRPALPHNGWVNAVQFGPDENTLLTASDDANVRLWAAPVRPRESAHLTLPLSLRGPAHTLNRRGATPGPFAVPVDDRLTDWRLIDPETLTEVHRLTVPGYTGGMAGILHGNKGRSWVLRPAAAPEELTSLHLWREHEGKLVQLTLNHPAGLDNYTFNSDDSEIITFSKDHRILRWRTGDGTLVKSIAGPAWDQVLPGSSGEVAVFTDYGALHLQRFGTVDLSTGNTRPINFAASGSAAISRAEISPDNSRLALGDVNGPITVIDISTGNVIARMKHPGNLTWIEWAPDSKRLLSAGTAPEVLVWDAMAGRQLLPPLRISHGNARVARWSFDGELIVTQSDSHQVRVWDSRAGEAITPLLPHEGPVLFAFVSPSGRLITASGREAFRAWDLRPTDLPVGKLRDHARLVSGRELNDRGFMLPLPPAKLGEIGHSLKSADPRTF